VGRRAVTEAPDVERSGGGGGDRRRVQRRWGDRGQGL
jgi:hypothetical protein